MRLEIEALGANELRCTIYLCVVVPPSLLDLPPELVRYMLQYLLLPSVALQRAATICKRMAGILCANEGHVARANRLVPMPVPAGSTALQQIAAFSSWHRQAGRWLNLARFYAEEQLIVQAVVCREWQEQNSIDSPTVEQALLDVLPERVLDDDECIARLFACTRCADGDVGKEDYYGNYLEHIKTEATMEDVSETLGNAFRDGKLRQGLAAVESALKDPTLQVLHICLDRGLNEFVQSRFEYAAMMARATVMSHHMLTPILSRLLGGALLQSTRSIPTSNSIFAVVEHVEANPPDLHIMRLTEFGRCVVTRIPDCPKAVVVSVNLEERWAVVVGPKASMLNERWRACSKCAKLQSSEYCCCPACENLVVPLIKQVSLDELECTRYALELVKGCVTTDAARGQRIEMLSTPDRVLAASMQLTSARAQTEDTNRLQPGFGVGPHWLFCGWFEHALAYRRQAAESVNWLNLFCKMIKKRLINDGRASEAEFDGHSSNVAILRIAMEKTGIRRIDREHTNHLAWRIINELQYYH